jgi:hypothetical protein
MKLYLLTWRWSSSSSTTTTTTMGHGRIEFASIS